MEWIVFYVGYTEYQEPGTGALRTNYDELSRYLVVIDSDDRESVEEKWLSGEGYGKQYLGEYDGVIDVTPTENIITIERYD